MTDLFDLNHNPSNTAPLAERLRPRNLDEFVGQSHIVGKGTSLRRLIEQDQVPSMILQGPPSSGKTSLATIISNMTNAEFIKLNAVSLSIAQLREVFEKAKDLQKLYNTRTVLFIDEIHSMKSNVQETLLPVVENGTITLIGCTTESIHHDIIPPLVSRCRIYRLNPLSNEDIKEIVNMALTDKVRGFGEKNITIEEEASDYLADICNGDIRNALNALEVAVYSLHDGNQIDLNTVQEAFQFRLNGITTNDMYNLTSAFCKSMRAGHTDGALYWMARLLYSGVDPLYIVRRVVVHAAEDVGMANPNALQMALSAKDSIQFVGMPEARMALAQAVIYICESPKSNSVYKAINSALETVKNSQPFDVPEGIKDGSRKYINPIDNPQSKMEYLPPELKGQRFYQPHNSGVEAKIYAKYDEEKIKKR